MQRKKKKQKTCHILLIHVILCNINGLNKFDNILEYSLNKFIYWLILTNNNFLKLISGMTF